MTNQEKLLILIEAATRHGWDGKQKHNFNGTPMIKINDLILDFEEKQVSFITALCKVSIEIRVHVPADKFLLSMGYSKVEAIRLEWSLLPTSKRLEFLLETFKHLL
jgi:hypothetical protein